MAMQPNYSDGFFCVCPEHGFLPVHDPLVTLPERYAELQAVLSNLPEILRNKGEIETRVAALPNYAEQAQAEEDVFVIQALFRGYTFLASGYLLEPSHHHNLEHGRYGPARRRLPENVAVPLWRVAEKLDVYPFLDYHYAYSSGNYVRKDPSKDLHWTNLDMSCKFSGTNDETGFIMVHVYINEVGPQLLRYVWSLANDRRIDDLEHMYNAVLEMNERRKAMWKASDYHNYNAFRVFIMGIKGNDQLFGDGVVYEGISEEPQQFRGQTGAQDDIIPTLDIFTGVTRYYPDNMLTRYLLDLRSYRPKCVQKFFEDVQAAFDNQSVFSLVKDSSEHLAWLAAIVDQVYLFRNGHWQFVQKYIMANTRYSVATGGTPITSWLPNQIEACLHYQRELLEMINEAELSEKTRPIFAALKETYPNKVRLLNSQIEELRDANFNVDRIYELNEELNLADAHLSS